MATCAHALGGISVRRMPAGAAERYLEEFEADLIELERSGGRAMLKHALGIVSISRRLNGVVARPAPPLQWALRALAHFGLAWDHRGREALCDAGYVFPRLRSGPRKNGPLNLSD